MNVASACANVGCDKHEERRCSRCQLVCYCKEECQRKHWKQHKMVCQKVDSKKNLEENAIKSETITAVCANVDCNKPGDKLCSGCQIICYCNEVCQKKHWKQHKMVCKKGDRGKNMERGTLIPKGATTVCANVNCNKPGSKKCSNSQLVCYCNEDCQKKHWNEHKVNCKRIETECRRIGCNNPGDMRCSQCKMIWYCNEECQINDWKEHEATCNNIKMNREKTIFTRVTLDSLVIQPISSLGSIITEHRKNSIPNFPKEYTQCFHQDELGANILSQYHGTTSINFELFDI